MLFGYASFGNQQTDSLISKTLFVDGHDRSFHYLAPKQSGASLLFVIHGSGGSGSGIRKAKQLQVFEQESRTENILVVNPDGYEKFWNECRKAAQTTANLEDINDNLFFEEMIRFFEETYDIDTNHVFAMGSSGGGHMCYKLALTMPEKIAAIAAFNASLPDSANMDCIGMDVPLPVMIVNGTADKISPYDGGEIRTDLVRLGTVRSTYSTFQYWASLAGYRGKPKRKLLPDTDPNDGKTIERYTYRKKQMPEVTLFKLIGGGHCFPNDINAYLEAWSFFKRTTF